MTSTAAAPGPRRPRTARSRSISRPTPVGNGLGGTQLPVLLAIVAIIALSLVTATYARMYLLPQAPDRLSDFGFGVPAR